MECLKGTALSHLSLKEGTGWGRRICCSSPQLLNQHQSHADLFLLNFGVCLQSRHPCFQPRYLVNELLILLRCLTHSSHGYNPYGMTDSFTLSQRTQVNRESLSAQTKLDTAMCPEGKQGTDKTVEQLVSVAWCL